MYNDKARCRRRIQLIPFAKRPFCAKANYITIGRHLVRLVEGALQRPNSWHGEGNFLPGNASTAHHRPARRGHYFSESVRKTSRAILSSTKPPGHGIRRDRQSHLGQGVLPSRCARQRMGATGCACSLLACFLEDSPCNGRISVAERARQTLRGDLFMRMTSSCPPWNGAGTPARSSPGSSSRSDPVKAGEAIMEVETDKADHWKSRLRPTGFLTGITATRRDDVPVGSRSPRSRKPPTRFQAHPRLRWMNCKSGGSRGQWPARRTIHHHAGRWHGAGYRPDRCLAKVARRQGSHPAMSCWKWKPTNR